MKNKFLFLGAFLCIAGSTFAKEVIEQPVIVEDTNIIVEPVIAVREPIFTKVSVGQNLEIDNTSGGEDIGESVLFLNEVALSTENWDYSLVAGTVFSSDTDDLFEDSHARMQLEAIRNFQNGFAGVRWRAEDDYNRYYFRTGYNYGILSGWMDAQYWSFDNGSTDQDSVEIEIMPANITLGPLTVGYYLDYIDYTGEGQQEDHGLLEKSYSHQIRAYLPLYSTEKLSFDLEYRLGLHNHEDYSNTNAAEGYSVYKDFGYNAFILNANYAVTENLDLSAYYRYDISDFESKSGPADTESGKYYGEFFVGWAYSF